jgi:hypothetical protein
MGGQDGSWLPEEPEPVTQADEPTEVRAISRSHQWQEHLSLVLLLGFLTGTGLVLILWGWFG